MSPRCQPDNACTSNHIFRLYYPIEFWKAFSIEIPISLLRLSTSIIFIYSLWACVHHEPHADTIINNIYYCNNQQSFHVFSANRRSQHSVCYYLLRVETDSPSKCHRRRRRREISNVNEMRQSPNFGHKYTKCVIPQQRHREFFNKIESIESKLNWNAIPCRWIEEKFPTKMPNFTK